ncbi:hypothetical protein BP5796_03743 [Coleophoma crateriformis]|uniref:Uncharacterized protein n=1 Tax=Coleophoma crateriformis TaxID=565419 RepID=A0A3D8SI20_9HELO|nr:hypothetical protein BP5796_03743 [Coleophoma crateriformis]
MESDQASKLSRAPSTPRPYRAKVEDTGFTTLYDGSGYDGEDGLVDIILVHGLGGHPEQTWSTASLSAQSQQTSSGSDQRLSRDWISTSRGIQGETFWPADFLPLDFPRARILSWGYDSNVERFFSGAAEKGMYYSHAKDLLSDLSDIRARDVVSPPNTHKRQSNLLTKQQRRRPVIWITHGLGCIIIQEALLHAHSDMREDIPNHLQEIYGATSGVVCLVAPYFKSTASEWESMTARFVEAAGVDANTGMLKQLTAQSPELASVQQQFSDLIKNSDFQFRTFDEGRSMEGLRGLNSKVIDNVSSTIGGFNSRTIQANHMESCRFSHPADIGYCRIKEDLNEFIDQIQTLAKESPLQERTILLEDEMVTLFSVANSSFRALNVACGDFLAADRGKGLARNPPQYAKSVTTVPPQHLGLLRKPITENDVGRDYDLHDVIKMGDVTRTHGLLAKGSEINEIDPKFITDLSLAISSGKVEDVDLLLTKGAKIERRHPYSMETPLMEAIRLKSHTIVDMLLQRGADSQATNRYGQTPLEIACGVGDKRTVDLILGAGKASNKQYPGFMSMPLILATKSNHSEIVDMLIQSGADIEAKDMDGQTSLHIASGSANNRVVEVLLRNGANIEAKEPGQSRTPLHCAAEYGNAAVVSLLISKGAIVDVPEYKSGKTALHLASENGHDAVVDLLIRTGADVSAKQYPKIEGKTPLHVAAQNGHVPVLELLCAKASKDAVNEKEIFDGNTPLLLAARGGHSLAVTWLLKMGADIEATSYTGSTAFYLAVKQGHEEVALSLLREGASVEWPDAASTPLQYAAFLGLVTVAQKLIALGADVQETNENGDTALHRASSAGRIACVSLLLDNKADLNAKNDFGYTALHQAARNGHRDVVRLLLTRGADLRISDKLGMNALHNAVSQGHEEVVKLLIAKGADLTLADQKSMTPLHLAAAAGYANITLLLLRSGAATDALALNRQTPLGLACLNGQESTAMVLINNGTRLAASGIGPPLVAAATGGHLGLVNLLLSRSDDDGTIGETAALLAAAQNGHAAVIKRLLETGEFDIDESGEDGLSALHLAATNGHVAAIQVLLEEGADIDQESYIEWPPICGAALNGHASAIRILLKAGSDIGCLQDIFSEDISSLQESDPEGLVRVFVENAEATKQFYMSIKDGDIPSIREQAAERAVTKMRDAHGNTPLHIAVANGHTKAISILCEMGVDVNTGNYRKQTALHEAVMRRHIDALLLLLHYGADVNAQSARGATALHGAVYSKQETAVRILLEAGADVSIKLSGLTALQHAERMGQKANVQLLSDRVVEE